MLILSLVEIDSACYRAAAVGSECITFASMPVPSDIRAAIAAIAAITAVILTSTAADRT
jgi:hypothetical protein